jgi:hypothetical protein
VTGTRSRPTYHLDQSRWRLRRVEQGANKRPKLVPKIAMCRLFIPQQDKGCSLSVALIVVTSIVSWHYHVIQYVHSVRIIRIYNVDTGLT